VSACTPDGQLVLFAAETPLTTVTATILPTTTITPTITPTPIPKISWKVLHDSEHNLIGYNAPRFLADYTFDFPSFYPDYSDNILREPLQSFFDSIYLDELEWKPEVSFLPISEDEYIHVYNSNSAELIEGGIFYLHKNISKHFSPNEFCLFLEQATLEGYGYALLLGSVENALIYLEEELGQVDNINLENNGYCSNFDVESIDYQVIQNQYELQGIFLSDLEEMLNEREAWFEKQREIYRDTKIIDVNIEYPDKNHAVISYSYEISEHLNPNDLEITFDFVCENLNFMWNRDLSVIRNIVAHEGRIDEESNTIVDFSTWGGGRGCEANLMFYINDYKNDLPIIIQIIEHPMIKDPVKAGE